MPIQKRKIEIMKTLVEPPLIPAAICVTSLAGSHQAVGRMLFRNGQTFSSLTGTTSGLPKTELAEELVSFDLHKFICATGSNPTNYGRVRSDNDLYIKVEPKVCLSVRLRTRTFCAAQVA